MKLAAGWAHSRRMLVTAAFVALAVAPAMASPPHSDFPLGQTDTGAICTAVQDWDDGAAQMRGGRAWAIRCLGFDAIFGHIYAFDREGPSAVGDASLWRKQLAERANCSAMQVANISGLSQSQQMSCKSRPDGVDYTAFVAVDGSHAAAAEGFAPIGALINLGLRIAMGVASVPASDLQTETSSGNSVGGSGNLAAIATAAQSTGDYLSSRAQLENKGWEFTDAERDFREIEASGKFSDKERVLAELNVALNVSNEGPTKFQQADKLFATANAKAAAFHDSELDGLVLNYQALHLLNEKKFADAAATAQRAIEVRRTIDPNLNEAGRPATLVVDKAEDAYEISPALAAGLNQTARAVGFHVIRLTLAEHLQIQDAQAQYVIGASRERLGDMVGARAALEDGDRILSAGRLAHARSDGWLHAEIYAALGLLDLKSGQAASAGADYQKAIDIFDRIPNLAASPAEADLYLGRGRAETTAGEGELALADYERGIHLFRNGRREVGEARDLIGPYFDLLLDRIQKGDSNSIAYKEDYFSATQVLAGQGTAKTFADFAAGASKGDERSEQLARELKENKRKISLKEDSIKRQQDSGKYTSDQHDADQAELARLGSDAQALQEKLLEANPKYGQVVEETASLSDVQKALAVGEVYVKTVLLVNRGYGIAITRDSVQTYPIALTRAEVGQKVSHLRIPFDDKVRVDNFDVPASRSLFASIFGPVQDEVRTAHHLIYDPDSAMVSLPAATFVTDDASVDRFSQVKAKAKQRLPHGDLYADVAWLGRSTDISLVVSSEVFLQSRSIARSKGRRGFVAFGDPVTAGSEPHRYELLVVPDNGSNGKNCEAVRRSAETGGFASLSDIRPAILAIGDKYHAAPNDILLGQSFTDASVVSRSDLNAYRIVFFGTHGVLPEKMPCLPTPTLVTSVAGDNTSDGFLDAAKIVKLTMDADLLVLAACDTGSAPTKTGETGLAASGDAFDGFARDFIYAGARTLVVSQWEVPAKQTAALMTRMFDASAPSQAGALRQAQSSMMDDTQFSNPYYWAGFTLVGDGAKPMPSP